MAGPLPSSDSSSAGEAGDDPRAGEASARNPDERADDVDAAPADTNDATEQTRRRLLAPIGGLYALAQALTSTEREARQLVEATYERAAEQLHARPSAFSQGDDVRPQLFKLLVQIAREAPSEARGNASEDRRGKASSENRHFRRRAQERFLQRALPPAFAALAADQRLLLTLCDIEELDTPAASEALDRAPDDLRRQRARARADLREALHQMAPQPERPFLDDDALPASQLAGALRRMGRRDLTVPPPALRPAARHALSRPRKSSAASTSPSTAPDRPAAESDHSEEKASPKTRRRLPRLLVALLLIAAAGGMGYLTTAVLDGTAETDLAAFSAQQAADVDIRLRTDRAERAEQFVRDELGRRVRVPQIESAALRGVGVAEVASSERVPVFLFRDAASGRSLTAYAYDYALLDRTGERLRLDTTLRRRLREEGRVVAVEVEDRRVLLWRHRDDIFAAVTARADSLQQRIAL